MKNHSRLRRIVRVTVPPEGIHGDGEFQIEKPSQLLVLGLSYRSHVCDLRSYIAYLGHAVISHPYAIHRTLIIVLFEAVIMAQKGDTVMIAGKGHEDYQILGTEKIHFDDREVAQKYINV